MKTYKATAVVILLSLCAGSAAAAYVAPNPRSWAGRPPVGDGECVALVKQAAGIAATTGKWKMGALVKGANLREGTAIASFINNKYAGHAALYLGQNNEGIQVVDQWAVRKDRRGRVIRPAQAPHIRTIYWNRTAPSDNGMLFHVID